MNRILYASDCLKVLNDRDALSDESVDLIYLDPPSNSNGQYNLPIKGKYKTARPVEAFNDTWHWTDENMEQLEELAADPRTRALADTVQFAQKVDQGTTSLGAFLINMAVRLYAMRRVLKKSGSIYLHCDSTAGHYLKLIIDAVFGQKAYRNEIIWKRTSGQSDARRFGRSHDVILYYSLSSKGVWNQTFQPYDDYVEQYYRYSDPDGRRPGADGGVDGVLKFYRIRPEKKLKPEYAIVQVKGGHVTPDAVRALRTTVDRFEVTAGVMVCFDQYMRTVENQRSRETFQDALGTYPVIQGYSVESLLSDAPLNSPLYGLRRQGARLIA